jgi:dihydroflavonol-4-reductase
VVVYPGAVLGPGDTTPSGQFIKDYVHGHMPGAAFGQSTMTWVHVRDVAEAIVRALEKENNLGEKYLLGKYSLTFQEYVALLSEISGSPPPRWIPDSITMAMVRLSQWVADLTGKLPAHATPLDGIRTLRAGFVFDGSKAERELGIAYTPMRVMLEESQGHGRLLVAGRWTGVSPSIFTLTKSRKPAQEMAIQQHYGSPTVSPR